MEEPVSTPDACVETGISKPFSCISRCLLLSEGGENGSVCLNVPACYS